MIQFFAVLLLFTSILLPREKESTLSYPHTVTWNTPFEVSLVSVNSFSNARSLEISITAPEGIELKKADINTYFGTSGIAFRSEGSNYSVRIDLSKEEIVPDSRFQIIFTFKPDNIYRGEIVFHGYYVKRDTILGSMFDEEDQVSASIEFYKPKKYAGRALHFKERNSEFIFKHSRGIADMYSVAADFWFRTSEKDFTLLKIKNGKEILADIFINSFGMLSLQSSLINNFLHPDFISSNSWNHITAVILSDKNTMEIYCNGNLIASNGMESYLNNDISFLFGGSDSKEFFIDQLKFSKAESDKLPLILSDRNFLTPPSGTEIIRIFSFDNDNLVNGSSGNKVEFRNLKFVKSDAPLGLRSPELNINILSSSFELEWSGGDYKQSQSYFLERSENNKEFSIIYSVNAVDDAEEIYRYTDNKMSNAEIIYYRVKQVLKDGSFVYSSQVKVGQGLSEPFALAQNFPNPFNPKTSIDVELFRDSEISVIVYNLEGKEVAVIFEGNLSKGRHKFSFDGGELPSGVYICSVTTPDFTQTTKMILTK